MHQKKYTLTQHTPLLYFQVLRDGEAALRPTELKPKLDRYLWKHLFEDDFETGKEYLAGYSGKRKKDLLKKFKDEGYRSLDYSVEIRLPDNWKEKDIVNKKILGKKDDLDNKNTETKKISMFFGNMGDDYGKEADSYKYEICYDKGLELVLSSIDKVFLDDIETHLQAFLMQTNFGTRQSKGYGCFTIKDKPIVATGFYKFEVITNWATDVELFYKVLRSGLNGVKIIQGQTIRSHYCKPLIFDLTKTQLQWEKKTIKENLFTSDLQAQQREHNAQNDASSPLGVKNENQKIIKDLFGLASTEAWKIPYNATITKEDTTGNVERLKSPLLIKPIKEGDKYTIYFKFFDIPSDFFEAKFSISDGRKSTPNLEPLKIEKDFFHKLIEYGRTMNWGKYVTTYNQDDTIIKKIEGIFKNITLIS